MNISKTIREQRNQLSLSQEELAEKLYVTRQTIGNWENDKSYPDIHSLILLSQLFDMTIDSLIKGDLEMMKQTIETKDIRDYKRNFAVGLVGVIGAIILLPFSWLFFDFFSMAYILGMAMGLSFGLLGIAFFLKCGLTEAKYDAQTFKEIIALTKGETLDEITKARESGKRVYQMILLVLAFSVLTAGLVIVILLFSQNF